MDAQSMQPGHHVVVGVGLRSVTELKHEVDCLLLLACLEGAKEARGQALPGVLTERMAKARQAMLMPTIKDCKQMGTQLMYK